MAWARTKRGKIRHLNRIVHLHSETQGTLQWTFGGPTRGLSPWAAATCRDLLHARDVAMIAAYFSPTWAMLRRICARRRYRPRADHHRRAVGQ